MMLAIAAFVCFILAAFKVSIGTVNLVDIGLAFLALALLFGGWPIRRA